MAWSVFLSFAALCALLNAEPVCSCVRATPGTPLAGTFSLTSYDAVFEGQVIERFTPRGLPTDDSTDRYQAWSEVRATVVVGRRWKGAPPDTVFVRTSISTTMCGFEFTPDRRFLIFAHLYEGRLYTTKCSPSTIWGPHAEELVRVLDPPKPEPTR